MDDYRYTPLDTQTPSFRLLKLKKGDTIKVECDVFHTILSDQDTVPFEALSYSWGSTELVNTIEVNGQILWITENLYSALQCLRYHDRDRVLWIDAICINQLDVEERSQQVLQMGKIFNFATRVVIWLGRPTAEAILLMNTLGELQTMFASSTQQDRELHPSTWGSLWSTMQPTQPPQKDAWLAQRQAGLDVLLKRPWFNRVWILQEVFNARSAIVCSGNFSVSANIFASCPSLLDLRPDLHVQSVLTLMPGPDNSNSLHRTYRNSLFDLLRRFRNSKATDPRDVIFALLGMSSEPLNHNLLRPDYVKSVHQVLHDTIRYWFEASPRSIPISAVLHLWKDYIPYHATYFIRADTTTTPTEKVRVPFQSVPILCIRDASLLQIDHILAESDILVHGTLPTMSQEVIEMKSALGGSALGESALGESALGESALGESALGEIAFALGLDYRIALDLKSWAGLSGVVEFVIVKKVREALFLVATFGLPRLSNFIADRGTNDKQRLLDDTLCEVVERGYSNAAQLLLEQGADVNAQGGRYGNVLQASLGYGYLDIVQLLLKRGADVNIQGGYFGSPLQAASSEGYTDIVQLLLEKGADANAQGGYYGNALQAALARNYPDQEVVQLLLDKRADANTRGGNYTEIQRAASTRDYERARKIQCCPPDSCSRVVKTIAMKFFRLSRTSLIVGHEQSVLSLCTEAINLLYTKSSFLDTICLPWAPYIRQSQRDRSEHDEDKDCYPSWIRSTCNRAFGVQEIAGKKEYVRIGADTLASPPQRNAEPYAGDYFTPSLPSFPLIEGRIMNAGGYIYDQIDEIAGTAIDATIPVSWVSLGWGINKDAGVSDLPQEPF